MTGVQEMVETYAAAWNEPDPVARRALLERSWADDGTYTDPTAAVAGREALIAHIDAFQQQFPGVPIVLTSGVDEHHGWVRFGWRMPAADGTVIVEGLDCGELAPDGRLRRIVGFFGPLPSAG